MKRRILPGTDLELSIVGFGCWPLGGEYWGPTDHAAHVGAVRTALECGINWFDTAPLYGKGRADEVLVEALGADRDAVAIATKVGIRLDGVGPESADGHAHSDLRPEHVLSDAEATVTRLGRPPDLLQVHWACEWGTPIAETAQALDEVVKRGLAVRWGVCNADATSLRAYGAAGELHSLQSGYSLMRREIEGEIVGAAQEVGVGILAYEALCRGLLSGKYRSVPRFGDDDMRSRDQRFSGRAFQYGSGLARDLGSVGRKIGVSASAVALGWVAGQRGITSVIAGCRSPEQVRQNVDAARVAGSAKVLDVVNRVVAARGQPAW